jgi:hypothetical protein
MCLPLFHKEDSYKARTAIARHGAVPSSKVPPPYLCLVVLLHIPR